MTAPSLGAYARTLARPVARELLTLPSAQAALRANAYERARHGTLGGDGDPEGAFAFANWMLHQQLGEERERYRAELVREADTEKRIKNTIAPLIGLRERASAIRARAHDVNAADGRPLDEDDVNQIVTEQLWWSLPTTRGGRRHG